MVVQSRTPVANAFRMEFPDADHDGGRSRVAFWAMEAIFPICRADSEPCDRVLRRAISNQRARPIPVCLHAGLLPCGFTITRLLAGLRHFERILKRRWSLLRNSGSSTRPKPNPLRFVRNHESSLRAARIASEGNCALGDSRFCPRPRGSISPRLANRQPFPADVRERHPSDSVRQFAAPP